MDAEEKRRGVQRRQAERRSGEGRGDRRPNPQHGLEDDSDARSFRVRGYSHDLRGRGSCLKSVSRRSDGSNDGGNPGGERVRGILHVMPTSGNPHTRERTSAGDAEAAASNFDRRRRLEDHARDKHRERDYLSGDTGEIRGRNQKPSRRKESKHGFMHPSDSDVLRLRSKGVAPVNYSSPSTRRLLPEQGLARGRGHLRMSYQDRAQGREGSIRSGGHGNPDWREELERAEGRVGKAVAWWVRGGNLPEPTHFKPVKQAW